MLSMNGVRWLLTGALFYLIHCQVNGQTKYPVFNNIYQYYFQDSTSNDPKLLVYPTVAYAPETRWEFGASGLYVYYAERNPENRLSEIYAFSFITLERQYGTWLDHALYSDKNSWFFLGSLRWQEFPLFYYGIGPDVDGSEDGRINAGTISIRERVLRQVRGNLYVGAELEYMNLFSSAWTAVDDVPPPVGAEQFQNFGIGVGLVYDERYNVLNMRDGWFGEVGVIHYDRASGSDFEFTTYFTDLRYFHKTTEKQVWASQFYFRNVVGEAPFNQLALMGGESLMRGYYLGRYRDQAIIAAQTEYRFLPLPFSRRWGAATFIGAGTVARRPAAFQLNKLKIAGGAGVRFLIFPEKDIFTRFDVAFSEDGPAFYFFIGEAF